MSIGCPTSVVAPDVSDWVPGVNNLGGFDHWAFIEFTAIDKIEAKFKEVAG